MKEQEQKEGEQQEWERGIKEREVTALEERSRPDEPKVYEWETKVNALVEQGTPKLEALKQVFNIKDAEDIKDRLQRLRDEERVKATGRAEGGGGGPTPYQKSTQDRMERNTMLSSIEHSLGSITTMFSDADKGALTGMTSDIDYKSLKKSRAELNRFRAKLLGGNKLSDTELTEATRIMTDPSAAFPTAPIRDVGGAVGQVLGGQGIPAGVLPPEVTEYIKKHPEVSPEQAMKLYLKWKQSR